MRISLFIEHVALSEEQKTYINRKVEHFERLSSRVADESVSARVEFRKAALKTTTSRIECIVNMTLPGKNLLHAEACGKTVEEAFDLVVSKLRRQIEKSKTVRLRRRRKSRPL